MWAARVGRLYVGAIMCTRMCGDRLETSFFSLRSGRDFQDVPPRILIASRRSSREAEYQ